MDSEINMNVNPEGSNKYGADNFYNQKAYNHYETTNGF